MVAGVSFSTLSAREKYNAARRARRLANPDETRRKGREEQRARRRRIPEQVREYERSLRLKRPEVYKARKKAAYWKDVEKSRARQNTLYATNEEFRQTAKDRAKQWRLHNPEKARLRERLRKKRTRLERALRQRLRSAIKNANTFKRDRTLSLLGCKTSFLKQYLEAKFCKGMTWENYGTVWHLDHRLPCAAFDLSKESEQRICFNWQNLQPLFKGDNLTKGPRFNTEQQPLALAMR